MSPTLVVVMLPVDTTMAVTSSLFLACSFVAQDADVTTAGSPAVSTRVGVL